MIKVTIGNSAGSKKVVEVDNNQTLRQTLDDAHIQYVNGSVHLNGETVTKRLDTTFTDILGPFTTECSLIVVVKGDAAR